MSRRPLLLMFILSLVVAVFGAGARDIKGLEFAGALFPVGLIFCCVFAGFLVNASFSQQIRGMKVGVEGIPPVGDVASVVVEGVPIPEPQKLRLMKAIGKARRAGTCGKTLREVRFQIVDRWAGTWDLSAFKDDVGQRGFVINRVAYVGKHAAVVASCVGI